MNESKKCGSKPPRKRHDVADRYNCNEKDVVKPTLYSSVIQTEAKLRQISLSRLEPKPITQKAGVKQLNFPLAEKVYNYSDMVDVGLNSGPAVVSKPKPREVHLKKKPVPKLSDYYRPNFNNAQRIQMKPVQTSPELTVQYDGLAVSRLLKEIDDLVFM